MNVIDKANASEFPPALHNSPFRFSWILALVAVSINLCAGAVYYWTIIETVFATLTAHETVPVLGRSPEDRETLSGVRSGGRRLMKLQSSIATSVRIGRI